MLAAGAVAGVLAGLLGIGGGIVIVPVLSLVLEYLGVDGSIRMHVAVGTSLATIIPTSLSSTRAHLARDGVDVSLARAWALYVLVGSALGVWLAAQMHSASLSLVFASVAFLIGVKLLLPIDDKRLADRVPDGVLIKTVPTTIGAVSSMMGIGGGTLTVAALTLLNHPIHRAVGTAALFGLAISLPGAIGFVIAGWGDPRLPAASAGFVSLPGLALIAPMTVLTAPLGAALAHRLSERTLSALFGVFLLATAVRMALEGLAG